MAPPWSGWVRCGCCHHFRSIGVEPFLISAGSVGAVDAINDKGVPFGVKLALQSQDFIACHDKQPLSVAGIMDGRRGVNALAHLANSILGVPK